MRSKPVDVLALGTAGVAALLASSCCLVPLVLVSAGLSGAWLSNLRALQPYSPIFIGIAVVALALAGRSLFRSSTSCRVDAGAIQGSGPSTRHHQLARRRKAIFWVIAAVTVILLVTPVVAPWFY
jgi:mercuric ion transport protein